MELTFGVAHFVIIPFLRATPLGHSFFPTLKGLATSLEPEERRKGLEIADWLLRVITDGLWNESTGRISWDIPPGVCWEMPPGAHWQDVDNRLARHVRSYSLVSWEYSSEVDLTSCLADVADELANWEEMGHRSNSALFLPEDLDAFVWFAILHLIFKQRWRFYSGLGGDALVCRESATSNIPLLHPSHSSEALLTARPFS